MTPTTSTIQKSFTYTQTNHASIDKVFPLLCPVREKDWLDDWEYRMIYSQSGLIEENCVFATPNEKELETIWHVTIYDKENHRIEFVRVTPGENVVRINIRLEAASENQTLVHITYLYTGLNQKQNHYIKNQLANHFNSSMLWWETAINYYLKNGEMLRKDTV
ncbi:hypothetical protein [Carboxylicivirga linearis]|uniref:SRPBCC family protein n=1 Tax=Carboxylicivirga linearis TaxID=1628157 RepID=A0ABS5JSM1_9BACT|nr:hypothetical protein [Carboxylicivirga linearis]MBS2097808.1 hypothetical protein [Carboxylicivirga linearis]